MGRPPSLGEQAAYARVQETYPLPPKRDLIATEVKRILDGGGVQKLTIQVGAPIVVERLVNKGELDPTVEQIEIQDLYSAARNAPMKDFTRVGDPMRTLFHAFTDMLSDNAVVNAFLYSNDNHVRSWLELPSHFHVATIFGIQSYKSTELPEDVLLVIGVDPSNFDVVVMSYRIAMDLPKKKGE